MAPMSGRALPYVATPRKMALPPVGVAYTWTPSTPVPLVAARLIAHPEIWNGPLTAAPLAGASMATCVVRPTVNAGHARSHVRVAAMARTVVVPFAPARAVPAGKQTGLPSPGSTQFDVAMEAIDGVTVLQRSGSTNLSSEARGRPSCVRPPAT